MKKEDILKLLEECDSTKADKIIEVMFGESNFNKFNKAELVEIVNSFAFKVAQVERLANFLESEVAGYTVSIPTGSIFERVKNEDEIREFESGIGLSEPPPIKDSVGNWLKIYCDDVAGCWIKVYRYQDIGKGIGMKYYLYKVNDRHTGMKLLFEDVEDDLVQVMERN